MKSTVNIVGAILIIFGVIFVAYDQFTYHTQEKVAEVGDLKLSVEREKTINFPPVLGGLCIVAGIVLVVVGRRKG